MLEELNTTVRGLHGYWSICANYDPSYPGVDIEYVPDKYPKKHLSYPRILFEERSENVDELRVLLWTDPHSEDYTEEIVFKER